MPIYKCPLLLLVTDRFMFAVAYPAQGGGVEDESTQTAKNKRGSNKVFCRSLTLFYNIIIPNFLLKTDQLRHVIAKD